jgi:hypothetical protein
MDFVQAFVAGLLDRLMELSKTFIDRLNELDRLITMGFQLSFVVWSPREPEANCCKTT